MLLPKTASARFAGRLVLLAALGLVSARAEEIISTTKCQLRGRRQPVTVEIVMTDGRFYDDQQGWCGGGEKWEGQFEFRVRSGHKLLSKTSVNRFFFPTDPAASIFFWSPKFKLVMRDYNRDGLMDFNLGQYGACMYNEYRIFTVGRRGTIRELPISGDDRDGVTVSWAEHENSTRRVNICRGLLTTSWYNHAGADVLEQRAWRRNKFVLLRSKLVDYDSDRERGPRGPRW